MADLALADQRTERRPSVSSAACPGRRGGRSRGRRGRCPDAPASPRSPRGSCSRPGPGARGDMPTLVAITSCVAVAARGDPAADDALRGAGAGRRPVTVGVGGVDEVAARRARRRRAPRRSAPRRASSRTRCRPGRAEHVEIGVPQAASAPSRPAALASAVRGEALDGRRRRRACRRPPRRLSRSPSPAAAPGGLAEVVNRASTARAACRSRPRAGSVRARAARARSR